MNSEKIRRNLLKGIIELNNGRYEISPETMNKMINLDFCIMDIYSKDDYEKIMIEYSKNCDYAMGCTGDFFDDYPMLGLEIVDGFHCTVL